MKINNICIYLQRGGVTGVEHKHAIEERPVARRRLVYREHHRHVPD